MTDLDKLIAAVEAGDFPLARDAWVTWSFPFGYFEARDAHRGSLDAALRLHEALLPGWVVAEIAQDAPSAWTVRLGRVSELRETADGSDRLPARAWLLAVLKALRAKDASNE